MYVTRPLSMYRKFPNTLSIPPPDAPYSGYLVITDEEAEAQDTFCWGACRRNRVKKLPFPQDKFLTIVHSSEYGKTTATKVCFIPVLDQPLSSNRYYVVRAKGKHKGKTCKCSREGDIVTCCFGNLLNDKAPKPFNIKDLYQQVKIHSHQSGGFFAKSITPDGVPPKFLRKKGWKVRSSRLFRSRRLSEALGLDASLRELVPDFNFPISRKRSASVVVGKWYCPFIFVREKARLRHQMKKSMFYSMSLEQKWEEIYSCGNDHESTEENVVVVNANVQREVILVAGKEAKKDSINNNGFIWFRVRNQNGRRGVVGVGLSSAIVENMKWVQEAGGWVNNGEEREVRVEQIRSTENGWERFGCYVLVESFVLRRMDGSLVLKWDFRHTHRIQCKRE